MTVNVSVRKNATAIITESLAATVLEGLDENEELNVMIYPGATVVVAEDGATAEELAALVAAAKGGD